MINTKNTKLSRFETANEKLIDVFDAENAPKAATEFQATLDEDSELMDSIISKVSQLKTLKDEVEKKNERNLRLAKLKLGKKANTGS